GGEARLCRASLILDTRDRMKASAFVRHYDDGLAAVRLVLPRVGDLLERERLEVDHDPAARDVVDELEVAGALHLGREREARVAEQVQRLAADVGAPERGLWAGGLPERDVARGGSGCARRSRAGPAPARAEGVRWA